MIEVKIGDKVKYDTNNSNMTWFGTIVKITEKYFLINSDGIIERVAKRNIVSYY